MSDSDLKEQRKKNLEQLKATGINVYPYSYKPDCTIQKVLEKSFSLIVSLEKKFFYKFFLHFHPFQKKQPKKSI